MTLVQYSCAMLVVLIIRCFTRHHHSKAVCTWNLPKISSVSRFVNHISFRSQALHPRKSNGWNPKSWRFGSDESPVQRGDSFRCQPLVFRGCKFPPTNYNFFTHQLRQIPKLPLSAQRMAWELNIFLGGCAGGLGGRTQVMCRKDGKFQEIHLPRFNVDILLGKFLVLSTLLRCVG